MTPIVFVVVDLTGSRLGPGWRRVELEMDENDRPHELIREQAAAYYEVPLEQVGPVTSAPVMRDE